VVARPCKYCSITQTNFLLFLVWISDYEIHISVRSLPLKGKKYSPQVQNDDFLDPMRSQNHFI
jgi:hypothetical protein